jgi:hypothetical protein
MKNEELTLDFFMSKNFSSILKCVYKNEGRGYFSNFTMHDEGKNLYTLDMTRELGYFWVGVDPQEKIHLKVNLVDEFGVILGHENTNDGVIDEDVEGGNQRFIYKT